MGTRQQDPDWTDREAEGLPDLEEQPPGITPETAEEGSFPPRDYPVGVTAWGVTAEEQSRPEPLDVRLSHERADTPGPPADDPEGRIRFAEGGDDTEVGEVEPHAEGLTAEEASIHLSEPPP
jgi:hypothetical protein